MKRFGRTFGLQWHLTDRCDQRCQHCYIWGIDRKVKEFYTEELDLKQCFAVVDKFLQFCELFGVDPTVSITGGDPILSPWFWQLIEYLHQKNVPFIILGNPFHLDLDVCRRLRNLSCNAYQMSLDGLEQTHDAIRKNGSFNATLVAVDMLRNSGIKTIILSTVSRLNYREIPELIRFVVDYGIDVYDFARYCSTSKDSHLLLTPQEYRHFLLEVWDIYVGLVDGRTKFPLKDHLWRLLLYEKELFKISKENVVLQGCNCGIRHMTVLADGTVYACRRFKSPVGNILVQPFQEIFLGQELSQYREIKKMEGCGGCELLNYCRGCHAVSYGTFENFFAKDPQCWKVNS